MMLHLSLTSHWALVLIMTLLVGISCQNAQSNGAQSSGEKEYDPVYTSHVGEITFMNGYVPYDQYSEDKMLTEFDFSESSNLNIRVFLDQPLAQYLQELTPGLSQDELCSNGNYQFSFYLNDQLAYQENLNTGAGSCEQKTTSTIFSVPLASTEREDSWGRYLWWRFLFRGQGDNILAKGSAHDMKIEIRPYINNEDVKLGDIIAKGCVKLNMIRPVATAEDIAIQEIESGSGWKISCLLYTSPSPRD